MVRRACVSLAALAACATAPAPAPPPPPPAASPQLSFEDQMTAECDRGVVSSCEFLEERSPEPVFRRAADKACALGDGPSCRVLGAHLEKSDPARAEALYWRACGTLDDLDACGILCAPALGSEPLPQGPHALAAAEKLCQRGPMPESDCGPLLVRLKDAPDAEVDRWLAVAACPKTPGLSCPVTEANIYLDLTTSRFGFLHRPAHAMQLLEEACEKKDEQACLMEAEQLYSGDLVKHDRPRAVEVATRACDDGSEKSCFFLGEVYVSGGKWHDLAKAIARFQQACGSEAACARVAGGYLAARHHLAEAEPFFQSACTQGDGDGCGELGRVQVLRGRRGPKVASLLQPSCEAGDRAACRALAEISSGEKARRYRELGRERKGQLGDVLRASYKRSWNGKGSDADTWLMAATVMTGGFPAFFALHGSWAVTGFGFGLEDYPDP